MKEQTKKLGFASLVLTFIGLPILLYATGDFPRRTYLKESFSILTILAFCLMLSQFFSVRTSISLTAGYSFRIKRIFHKVIGYVFITVLLLHPFLIVVPRYFESGVDSREAFLTIITTFDSRGIIFGILSWCLTLILAATSLFRNRLPLSYKTWRTVHGILSSLCICLAAWHAIDLGRHTDLYLSTYMLALLGSGLFFWLKSPSLPTSLNEGN